MCFEIVEEVTLFQNSLKLWCCPSKKAIEGNSSLTGGREEVFTDSQKKTTWSSGRQAIVTKGEADD